MNYYYCNYTQAKDCFSPNFCTVTMTVLLTHLSSMSYNSDTALCLIRPSQGKNKPGGKTAERQKKARHHQAWA